MKNKKFTKEDLIEDAILFFNGGKIEISWIENEKIGFLLNDSIRDMQSIDSILEMLNNKKQHSILDF